MQHWNQKNVFFFLINAHTCTQYTHTHTHTHTHTQQVFPGQLLNTGEGP